MVTTTTFPGLVTIDPIQGLQDYVLDIKPYHTKVFETLVEYVYTDYVNVNIVDVNNLAIAEIAADGVNATVNEDSDLVVPAVITEMFDFFITPPTPVTLSIKSTDATNGIVYFTGNVIADFLNGDLVVVSGTATGNDGKYQILTVSGYDSVNNQTGITLNTLAGTNGGAVGSATDYPAGTNYSFQFPIQSAVVGPIVVTEPVTGTTFNVSTLTARGNLTRAIQPGSVIQAVTTLTQTTPYLYYVAFVQFLPSFNIDGSRNPAGDTTVIGVELNTIFTDAVIGSGFIIPYNITGYDDRYDAPYDGMAGYVTVSG